MNVSPHSLDAERAILGGILLDDRAVPIVASIVTPSDFYDRANATVFRTMLELHANGSPIDTVTILERLKARGELERAGGDGHVLSLTNTIPTQNVEAHARIVRELAMERERAGARRDAVRAIEAGDDEEARRALDVAMSRARPALSARWLAELGDDPIGAEPPRRRFLMRRIDGPHPVGWLPAGEVGLVVAHGGVGKSTALIQVALSVASGSPLFDVLAPVDPGPVAVLALEDDMDEVRRRLHWASVAAWLDEDARSLAASRIRVITPPRDTVLVAPDARGVPREQPVVGELLRDLRGAGVDWRAVILDPLNRLHACDENANGAMGHVIATIERFKELPGSPTVLVAHHSSKGAGAAASRGATAIVNGARWCAHLEPDEGDVVRLEIVKSNYTARGTPILLTRRRDTRGALVRVTAEEEAVVT